MIFQGTRNKEKEIEWWQEKEIVTTSPLPLLKPKQSETKLNFEGGQNHVLYIFQNEN